MCKFIGIEDLAANALIELIKSCEKNPPEVSFKQLIKYGNAIITDYRVKNNEDAVLVLSREGIKVIRDYSSFFTINHKEDGDYFTLVDGVSADDLRKEFRSKLPIELLYSFISEEALLELGIIRAA